mmetsp:Transcript_1533/g.3474  ORF Transcript_1533/g.3474 Transcript_1533/m.3474 type:complete len:661 (-) Transcript_1533:154-2136(-)
MLNAKIFKDAAECLGVFVRPAQQSDTDQLITLNQNFRYEMAQWEAGHSESTEDSGYPVLDADDVNFILTQEDPNNLVVIGRRLESEERLIGYSYSYTEPWEISVKTPAKRTLKPTPRKKKGKGKGQGKAPPPRLETPTKASGPNNNESLYLAELFIAQCERGFGLGELLLTGTLYSRRKTPSLRSHLFVSSLNVSAVKCYQKFGYAVGSRPSGDVAHDLVMELRSCQESVTEAFERLEQQLADGNLGTTRRRRRPSPNVEVHSAKSSTEASPTSPRDHISKPCRFVPEASDSRASNAPTETAASRSSSRSSPSVSPNVIRPQPTRIVVPQNKRVSTRRLTRSGAAVSPLYSGKCTESMQSIMGRQRKPRNASTKSHRKKEVIDLTEATHQIEGGVRKGRAVTRGSLKPKFLFTGMRSSIKQAAEDSLKQLGCDVISTETYDPRCTHVVASHPIRTEKFLCAIAAGKHLLQPSYVFDSVEQGKLLPEEDYEWVRPRCAGVSAQGKVGAKCGKKEGFTPTGSPTGDSSGCFLGMVAIMVPSDATQGGLKRVLEAGNATIRCAHHPGSDVREVTHAFVASNLLGEGDGVRDKKALETLEELQSLGVHCLREEFIVDFLTSEKPITEEPYILSPSKTTKGASKRKGVAEEVQSAGKRGRACRVA